MEQAASVRTREIVAAVVTAIHACRAYTLALKTVGSAIAAVSVLCAIVFEIWYPLLFTAAILSLPVLSKWMKRSRLHKLHASIVVAQRDTDLNAETFEGLINHLNRGAMSISERNALTAAARFPVLTSND